MSNDTLPFCAPLATCWLAGVVYGLVWDAMFLINQDYEHQVFFLARTQTSKRPLKADACVQSCILDYFLAAQKKGNKNVWNRTKLYFEQKRFIHEVKWNLNTKCEHNQTILTLIHLRRQPDLFNMYCNSSSHVSKRKTKKQNELHR